MIDLCAKHDIKPDIEIVPVEGINKVYENLDGANDSGKRCDPCCLASAPMYFLRCTKQQHGSLECAGAPFVLVLKCACVYPCPLS